eukprot:491315_1
MVEYYVWYIWRNILCSISRNIMCSILWNILCSIWNILCSIWWNIMCGIYGEIFCAVYQCGILCVVHMEKEIEHLEIKNKANKNNKKKGGNGQDLFKIACEYLGYLIN